MKYIIWLKPNQSQNTAHFDIYVSHGRYSTYIFKRSKKQWPEIKKKYLNNAGICWSPFYFDVYDVIDLGEINYRKERDL